jgi:type IV pilus assembly protein PilX
MIPLQRACRQTVHAACGAERGMALPVVIVIMVVIALLATSGMDDASMQERMSGNLRDREMAFQAAEAALRAGEQWVLSNPNAPLANELPYGPEYASWDGVTPVPTGSLSGLYTTADGISLAADPAFYVGQPQLIEDPTALGMSGGRPPPRLFYPVLARAVGGTTGSVVVLRTVYWVE